jgi:hypothetical protein
LYFVCETGHGPTVGSFKFIASNGGAAVASTVELERKEFMEKNRQSTSLDVALLQR